MPDKADQNLRLDTTRPLYPVQYAAGQTVAGLGCWSRCTAWTQLGGEYDRRLALAVCFDPLRPPIGAWLRGADKLVSGNSPLRHLWPLVFRATLVAPTPLRPAPIIELDNGWPSNGPTSFALLSWSCDRIEGVLQRFLSVKQSYCL